MRDSIPWRRILAEGAVIIVSILLALSADAWWDSLQERRQERAALLQLHDELLENRARLQATEVGHRQQRDATAELLATVARRGDPPDSYVVSDSVLLTALGWRLFEPARGVVTSLISSGRLGVIRDDTLRIALASWLDDVEALRVDEQIDGDIRLEVRAVVHQYVPMSTLLYRRGEDGVDAPSAVNGDYRALLSSLEFENLLAFRLQKKNEVLFGSEDGYEPTKARLEELVGRIEANLR
jgi:hypothetical protein